MSLDKNRILVECEKCGLIFRCTEKESERDTFCNMIPEKDLSHRRRQCLEVED